MKKNYYCLVIDNSGSMGGLERKVVESYNKIIEQWKNDDARFNQQSFVSLIIFNSTCEVVFINKKLNDVPAINYQVRGSTALWDATGLAINTLNNISSNKEDALLVFVLTDGGENYSVNHKADSIKKLMRQENLTVVFSGPHGSRKLLVRELDISPDNVIEWEQTEYGLEQNTNINLAAFSNYAESRSRGILRSQSFYKDIDLGGLPTSVVKSNLTDVHDKFSLLNVNKSCQIKDFVEQNGYRYKKGIAFYQLTKSESVQENKEVLVREKNKLAIYGGKDARDLLGIGPGRLKIRPVDLGRYDVFVQSTSVNRKLIPGTSVLIRS